MSLETFVAGRYLRAKRQESFISVIAGFSLIGIGLGVATLIIVMSVMNGFRHELVSGMLGINGHVNVYSTNEGTLNDYDYQVSLLSGAPGIVQVLPVIEGQALITYEGAASGVVVRGMNADDFKKRPLLAKSVNPDILQNFTGNSVFIGSEMANRMRLGVGDVLTLISPKPKNTPFGSMPRSLPYRVGGIFDVGMYEYNNSFIFMPLEAAQGFFEMPERVSTLEIVTDNMLDVKPVMNVVQEKLGSGYAVRGWQDNNSTFLSALDVESQVMFLILTMIILIAAFNIISSLIMLVKDKSRDIAILRTMGASKGQVLRIFLITGASIGIAGTIGGTLLGIVITANLGAIQHGIEAITHSKLFPAEIYFLTKLPAIIDWREVTSIILMALGLSFGATIYPAWRAARLDPVEALRYA